LTDRHAIKWVRELFKEHKRPAVFFVDGSGAGCVIAPDELTARAAADLLAAQMATADLPVAESKVTTENCER